MADNVVVTGANGWIGGKLARRLSAEGWNVTGVSRTPDAARAGLPDIEWVGLDTALEEAVARAGAVVNLAGRHLLEQPWDDEFKAAMYDSRIALTERVVKALSTSTAQARVLVNGSGYPVYGDTGDEEVSEEYPVSRASFLSRLDADWEAAARAADAAGVRVVLARLGLVFGTDGGAFPVLKQPFDDGMGVVLGTGDQWIPWVHIDDAVAMLAAMLADERWTGPVNAAAPNPVRHADFASALAGVTGKPCEVTVPPPQVTESMGGAAELVLMSSRLIPQRPQSLGFEFRYPEIHGGLHSLLH